MNHAQAMQSLTTCDISDACDALRIDAVTDGAVNVAHTACGLICGPVPFR
jgi:hypothetical protein